MDQRVTLALLLAFLISLAGCYSGNYGPSSSAGAKRNFRGHKLVRLTCRDSGGSAAALVPQHSSRLLGETDNVQMSASEGFLRACNELSSDFPDEFDVWRVRPCDALVRLPGRRSTRLDERLKMFHVEMAHEDVQELVDAERVAPFDAEADDVPEFLKDYQPLAKIEAFMDDIAEKHPDLVSHVKIGKSYEGRMIRGLKFSKGSPKLSWVMHGATHAREFISVAVMNYMIHRLVTDGSLTELLDKGFEMTIIPVLNVDGYVYAHEHDRMWRKNRQPNKSVFPLPSCTGTDTNRNWGYKWNEGGSSTNPCADNYQGPFALSAPETAAMSRFLEKSANASIPTRVYIDAHAFSQLWMFPFGWTCDTVKGLDKVEEAAKRGAAALKAVHGKSFAVGGICKIIYQAAGSSVDSAFSFGIHYAYGLELRDTGASGFLLPRAQIIPSGEELEAGLIAMGKYVLKQKGDI